LLILEEEMIEPLESGELPLAIGAMGGVIVDPLSVDDLQVAADIAWHGIAANIARVDIGAARFLSEVDDCGRLGIVRVHRAIVRC